MSDQQRPEPGSIAWVDLTVPDAEKVREFYSSVVGWSPEPIEMEGYRDYNMNTPGGECAAGVCHSRGTNAAIPPQWMIYIVVPDVDVSAETCRTLGGEVLVGPKGAGGNKYCVIRDPAGAVCALYESAG